ncbi:MAG: ATP12 family chaperone protein [Tsuneonella sp.]
MKRFWKNVSVRPVEGGWQVMLDERPLRTQQGAQQIVPSEALAELLAGEWRAQGEEVDPAAFALRDMADYAIDQVASARSETIAKLLRYGETDTLCYRADPDEPLHRRQWDTWEPLLTAFEAREGVKMERVSGVLHKPQPAETMAMLRRRLEELDPFELAALEAMTSLAASLSIGLSALAPDADPAALWRAAELEEQWQAELWGSDTEAEERRERRTAAFLDAARFARAASPCTG